MDSAADGTPAGATVSIGQGFANALGNALAKAALLALSTFVAVPAIASILMLWAGSRWPLFGRSIWMNAVAGVALTFGVGVAFIFGANGLAGVFGDSNEYFDALAILAFALLVAALWLQFRARASFSRARGIGLLSAVMTPVAYLLVRRQFMD